MRSLRAGGALARGEIPGNLLRTPRSRWTDLGLWTPPRQLLRALRLIQDDGAAGRLVRFDWQVLVRAWLEEARRRNS